MTTVEQLSRSPAAPGRLGGWISRNGPVLGVFAVVFALWEIAVRALGIPDYILPAPSVIIAKIVVSWQLLLSNAIVTLQEILLGFGLSVLVAIPLAVAVVSRLPWPSRKRPSMKAMLRPFFTTAPSPTMRPGLAGFRKCAFMSMVGTT